MNFSAARPRTWYGPGLQRLLAWLQTKSLRSPPEPALEYLDSGEREAIALAEELKADQLLLDETDTRRKATRRKYSRVSQGPMLTLKSTSTAPSPSEVNCAGTGLSFSSNRAGRRTACPTHAARTGKLKRRSPAVSRSRNLAPC